MGNTTNPVALRSLSVTVTATEVQFVFRNRPNFGRPYFGGLYADLAQAIPTGFNPRTHKGCDFDS